MAASGRHIIQIMLNSQFDPKGFQTAIRAINGFTKSINNAAKNLKNLEVASKGVNKNLAGLNKEMSGTQKFAANFANLTRQMDNYQKKVESTSKSINKFTQYGNQMRYTLGGMEKQVQVLGSGMNQYYAQIKKATEWSKIANPALRNFGEGFVSVQKNVQQATSSIPPMIGGMQKMSSTGTSTMGQLTGAVSSGVSRIGGYFGTLINHTISVGDVFGFYIGTIVLQAIYDMTIGMSILKDNAISTFKFIGMGTQEIKKMMDGIQKLNANMPTVNFADMLDAMQRIRLSAKMSGDQMVKYGGVVGDTIALFVQNGRSAQDASLAIADAMSGAPNSFRRMYEISGLLNKSNMMAHGWSGKNDDIVGFFTALDAIYKDMDISGISTKITSLGDAISYLQKQFTAGGTKISDYMLPALKDFVLLVGKIVSITPAPILAIGLGITALTAFLLVAMPLLAAFVSSFETLGVALIPVISRLTKFKALSGGQKKLIPEGGYESRPGFTKNINYDESTPIDYGKKKKVLVGVDRDGNKVYEEYVKNIKKVDKADDVSNKKRMRTQQIWEDLSGKTDKHTKSMGRLDKMNTKVTGSFGKVGKGLKGVGSAVGGVLGTVGGFLATNPIGIILDIIMVLILVIDLTDSWGQVGAVLTDIWNGVIYVFGDLINTLKQLGGSMGGVIKDGYNSVKAWEGWKDIKEAVGDVVYWMKILLGIKLVNGQWTLFGKTWREIKTDLISIYNWIQKINKTPVGDVYKVLIVLPTLINPILFVISTFILFKDTIKRTGDVFKEFIKTAEGSDLYDNLINALVDLSSAWYQLQKAIEQAWTEITPALTQLGTAFDDLMEVLNTVSSADSGFKKTGDDATDTGKKYQWLVDVINGLITIINFLTWAIKVLTPVIQGVIYFIGGLAYFGALLFGVLGQVYKAVMDLWRTFGILGAFIAPLVALLMPLWITLRSIYCIIVGCSPGVVPAIRLLVAIAQWAFPIIAAVVGIAIGMAKDRIKKFVNDTVKWFRELPGKIRSALAGIKGAIVSQLQSAYDGAVAKLQKFYDIGVKIKDKVIAGIKGALHIKSPSKVTYGLGEMISQGLLEGMSNYVSSNATMFSETIKKELGGVLGVIQKIFAGWNYVFYYNSRQSVATSLKSLTGNCYDAATACVQLAQSMGLAAQNYRTFVNGIAHRIVYFPQLKAWFDPSGVMGSGIHMGAPPGSAAGGGGAAGGNVTVYQNNPVVRDELDLNKLALRVGRRTYDAVRYNV